MIVFAQRVGTAPGTSTLLLRRPRLNGLGVQCEPIPGPLMPNIAPWSPAAQPYDTDAPPPEQVAVRYDPYQDIPTMKGLGMVLTPPFVTRSLPGRGPWADDDPYYNQDQDGTAGFYHDTPLGAIPTDFDLATQQCYTPVQSGWISALNGARARLFGGRRGLAGALRDTSESVDALTKAQDRAFWLATISTSAVVILAGVNLFRLWKGK